MCIPLLLLFSHAQLLGCKPSGALTLHACPQVAEVGDKASSSATEAPCEAPTAVEQSSPQVERLVEAAVAGAGAVQKHVCILSIASAPAPAPALVICLLASNP